MAGSWVQKKRHRGEKSREKRLKKEQSVMIGQAGDTTVQIDFSSFRFDGKQYQCHKQGRRPCRSDNSMTWTSWRQQQFAAGGTYECMAVVQSANSMPQILFSRPSSKVVITYYILRTNTGIHSNRLAYMCLHKGPVNDDPLLPSAVSCTPSLPPGCRSRGDREVVDICQPRRLLHPLTLEPHMLFPSSPAVTFGDDTI